MIIDTSEQGSVEWFQARAGVITASNFAKVLCFSEDRFKVIRPTGTLLKTFDTKSEAEEALKDAAAKSKMDGDWKIEIQPGESGKTRTDYMLKLATEIITGKPVTEDFISHWMDRGNEIEDQARAFYELCHPKRTVKTVGLIYLDKSKRVGASLDSLIDDDGANEIKCPKLTTHITYLRENRVPPEYYPQVQGQLWVSKRKWSDFVSFHPDSHVPGFFFRSERDEVYIARLKDAVQQFIRELDELVAELKTLTARKAA